MFGHFSSLTFYELKEDGRIKLLISGILHKSVLV